MGENAVDKDVCTEMTRFVDSLHSIQEGCNFSGVRWFLGEEGIVMKRSEIIGIPSFDFTGNGKYLIKEYNSGKVIARHLENSPINDRRIEFVSDKRFYVIKKPFVVKYEKNINNDWQRSLAQFSSPLNDPEKLHYGKKSVMPKEEVLKYLELRKKIDEKANIVRLEPFIF